MTSFFAPRQSCLSSASTTGLSSEVSKSPTPSSNNEEQKKSPAPPDPPLTSAIAQLSKYFSSSETAPTEPISTEKKIPSVPVSPKAETPKEEPSNKNQNASPKKKDFLNLFLSDEHISISENEPKKPKEPPTAKISKKSSSDIIILDIESDGSSSDDNASTEMDIDENQSISTLFTRTTASKELSIKKEDVTVSTTGKESVKSSSSQPPKVEEQTIPITIKQSVEPVKEPPKKVEEQKPTVDIKQPISPIKEPPKKVEESNPLITTTNQPISPIKRPIPDTDENKSLDEIKQQIGSIKVKEEKPSSPIDIHELLRKEKEIEDNQIGSVHIRYVPKRHRGKNNKVKQNDENASLKSDNTSLASNKSKKASEQTNHLPSKVSSEPVTKQTIYSTANSTSDTTYKHANLLTSKLFQSVMKPKDPAPPENPNKSMLLNASSLSVHSEPAEESPTNSNDTFDKLQKDVLNSLSFSLNFSLSSNTQSSSVY